MELLGLPWRAAPADVDEAAFLLDGQPLLGALSVAAAKAAAAGRTAAADELVLAADTLVVADGDVVLGKPRSAAEARGMLSDLRARRHDVLTGVAVRAADGRQWGGVVSTRVGMRRYADGEIDSYVARGEPFDKAGGYAIQDEVFRPVAHLEGCYLNVVGLPLCAVAAGLAALGVGVSIESGGNGGSGAPTPPCGWCRAGAPRVAIRSAY